MSRIADIILISWNGADDTMQAMASIAPQVAAHPGVRVIVVDNGSQDDVARKVQRAYPATLVIRLAENRGFTGGIAAGVQASDADSVIFLNNDATAEAGWLAALLESMASAEEDVVAVAGKIIDPSGELIDFIGGAMTFDGHAFQRGFRRPLGSVVEPEPGSEMLFACGGNMIVRRRPFISLGGFDDDYFAYLEDVDFGWRAWISGLRITWEPRAVVRHASSKTSDRLGSFERGVLFERNALQTVIKNVEEARFGEATAPVFLTLLHRLHRYTVDRNGDTSSLVRPAFGEKAPTSRPGKRRRTAIEDPLTEMQFRATEWFFKHSDGLMKKRAEVQKQRRRSDAEIFERFPPLVVPTYHGDEALMSSTLFDALTRRLASTRVSLDAIIRR
jgi:GT2 family glycosyltransferase